MTEDDIKLEHVTFEIKKNYKYALAQLDNTKKDIVNSLNIQDRLKKEITEAKAELNELKNAIAEEKLAWDAEHHSQLMALEQKQSEAENVLKRKAELNEQEQRLRDIESSTIEARNETRQLEIKINAERDAIAVENKDLSDREKQLKQDKLKILKDKEAFKEKVNKVLQEVEKL